MEAAARGGGALQPRKNGARASATGASKPAFARWWVWKSTTTAAPRSTGAPIDGGFLCQRYCTTSDRAMNDG